MKKQYINCPEIVEKDEFEIRHIISLIKKSGWPDDIQTFVIKCIELALWLPVFLQSKKISLYRLRTMIFGKGYNKKNENTSNNQDTSLAGDASDTKLSDLPSTSSDKLHSGSEDTLEITSSTAVPNSLPTNKKKQPGHGRMPHTMYKNCTEVRLLLNLTIGDDCPALCGGKLGGYKPGIIVRVRGQNFAQVHRYTVEKLRCNLCGIIVAADIPEEVGDEKYDESFKAMVAIMKYYVGIPFYRQQNFQKMLDFPLSDATQWVITEQLAGYCYAPYNALEHCAANGKVMQNDDTTLRILETIKQIKEGTAGERTGMYTTGIIATYEGHQIALFKNGRQHSGENTGDVLKLRDSEKPPIIQMSDALSANIPKGMQTILCNCLTHGFRKFKELVDFFKEECIFILKKLSQVFEYDSETKAMNDQERLTYHQKHSKPIMDELEQYMAALIAERRIEPNGELGKAIKYMQNHWTKLTKFLTVAGAPIENNIVERALKVAIRNRKSALFYRTVYSAGIGGMLTSLIYTCHLNNQNPHHYLIALQIHQSKVVANPGQWLPWNYLETIAKITGAHALPEECKVAA